MEEATLRAKIQAMKNLLNAKEQRQDRTTPFGATSYGYTQSHHGQYQPNKYTHSTPGNRSWNRFSSPGTAVSRRHMGVKSANKVWKNENATAVSAVSPRQAKRRAKTMQMKAHHKTWTHSVSTK